MNNIKRYSCYLAWLTAGVIILFWKLDDLVGLHRDEAIFGLSAEMILNGARPLSGIFNYYTSPVYAYLLAIITKIFGNTIWSLRLLGPVFALVTIAAIFDIIRQYSHIRARWVACFLITFPPLIMFSRLCGEIFVLNPFLFFGTIWIYVKLCLNQKKHISIIGYILAGFLLSLGIWNHVIFLPGALSLIICYLIFLWPGLYKFISQSIYFSIGFFIGLIPRFFTALIYGKVLIPDKPSIPLASIKSSLLNLLYTLSGDGLYARFSGGSTIPFAWEMLGILIFILATFFYLRHKRNEKKTSCGIWVFLVLNFFGIWYITPFGSMGSRLWIIPVWLLPILIGMWIKEFNAWKWRITGSAFILLNLILLLLNYYTPNSRSNGFISPSVYVGGKYDNTWDYYDHRQIVKKLAQTDSEYIFISNANVFTFYYLMPEDQKHRIKLLWSLNLLGPENTSEIRKLYNSFIYKGTMPASSLFVFYDSDKDYLNEFSKLWFYPSTILDSELSIPGFKIFRFK